MAIGEPQRAFYGNQYSLTMPVFTHYGVELWVPEIGGPIDPDSEAHDLIMSVFGGMSKGERNRIKLRVRAAMAAQAAIEGRFLGGRPPYGYRIADAGPHPNPAKAADGKRLHKLEPDPETAWVIRRIFAEYLAGRGLFAIAEGLTRDRVPPRPSTTPPATPTAPGKDGPRAPSAPSCATPATPAGRSGTSSARTRSSSTSTTSPAATRPGCAGTTPASGSGPTSSPRSHWSLSRTSRPPRPSRPTPAAAARAAARPVSRSSIPTSCAAGCTAGTAAARCNASTVTTPPTTGAATRGSTPSPATSATPATSIFPRPASCPPSTTGYQSSSRRTGSPGQSDPPTVAEWTRQVKADRAAALARDASQARSHPGRQLTQDDISALITSLGDLRNVIRDAGAAEKAAIYDRLGLKITFKPEQARKICGAYRAIWGYGSCPRGDCTQKPMRPYR